jgi:hypothetical protein
MKAENMEMHIEAFRCYKPQPGDVLVVRPVGEGQRLGTNAAASIKDAIADAVPEFVKIIVLDTSLDIEIIRNGEQA